MRKLAAALALVAVGASCIGIEKEPEFVFVYEVGGRGGTVDVTYRGDDGLVEEEVTVPWTSEEMYTDRTRELRIEATGEVGDSLVCTVRWRLPEGRYDQDGSGASMQENDLEEAHRCRLDTTAG